MKEQVFERLNACPIEIEYLPDPEDEKKDYQTSFEFEGVRYYLADFITTIDNPWTGPMDVPGYIHGYDATSTCPLFVERAGEDYVNLYSLRDWPDTQYPELALVQKPGCDGLSLEDTTALFHCLGPDAKGYPIELEAMEQECSAMGFISTGGANKLDYDYEGSGLHRFIAEIMDDVDRESENGRYMFRGLYILLI